jgi:type IV secretory pathway VirB6-like protein
MLKMIFAVAALGLAFSPLTASAAKHHAAHHAMHRMMVMVNGHMAPVFVMMNGHMMPVFIENRDINGG